ncbi:MAG TPA: outer membrane beta-barrel protein [Vicinamibacterales bacterium]|nr:outer membrane beta-barrel protein [Vicinamibacterales bacterium]
MHVPLKVVAAVAVVGMCAASANAADGTQGDLAGGYSYMYDHDLHTSFVAGWFASAGVNVARMLAVVGDVTGNYKSQSATAGVASANSTSTVYTFLGGPRIVSRSGAARLFLQFLAGGATTSAGITSSSGSASVSAGDTRTDFCYVPGVGLDIGFNTKIAMRIEGNERFIRATGNTSKQFYLEAGLVYRFDK